MKSYEIIDTDYFNSLPDSYKKIVTSVKEAMKERGLTISRDVARNNTVDLIKMMKEGFLFDRFLTINKKNYFEILTRCFGIKEYYILIRMNIRRLHLNAINLYYSNAIQFFDIQQLVHFPKDKQERIIDALLYELNLTDEREKRTEFFRKHTLSGGRGKYKKRNRIPEELLTTDDLPKKKERRNIKELQAKRIEELNQKVAEMKKFAPAPTVVQVKKDVPKDESDYYNNHLEMVIPDDVNI